MCISSPFWQRVIFQGHVRVSIQQLFTLTGSQIVWVGHKIGFTTHWKKVRTFITQPRTVDDGPFELTSMKKAAFGLHLGMGNWASVVYLFHYQCCQVTCRFASRDVVVLLIAWEKDRVLKHPRHGLLWISRVASSGRQDLFILECSLSVVPKCCFSIYLPWRVQRSTQVLNLEQLKRDPFLVWGSAVLSLTRLWIYQRVLFKHDCSWVDCKWTD